MRGWDLRPQRFALERHRRVLEDALQGIAGSGWAMLVHDVSQESIAVGAMAPSGCCSPAIDPVTECLAALDSGEATFQWEDAAIGYAMARLGGKIIFFWVSGEGYSLAGELPGSEDWRALQQRLAKAAPILERELSKITAGSWACRGVCWPA